MGFYETLKRIGAPALVAGTILTAQAQAQDTKPAPAPTTTTAPAAGGVSEEDKQLLEAAKRQKEQRKAAAAAAGNAIRHDAQSGVQGGDCVIVTPQGRAVAPPMSATTTAQMLAAMNKSAKALHNTMVCGPEAGALWNKAIGGVPKPTP